MLNPTISTAPYHPQTGFSIIKSTTPTTPIIKPPRADTARPRYETPPFVPFGTGDQVRIWSGREVDRIPSSEARVSARHVEKWLGVSGD